MTALPVFDPFDASPERDLVEGFASLRRDRAVWEFQPGIFFLTRYADVRAVLYGRNEYSNHANFFLGRASESTEPPNITHMDPPEHTVLRRVLLQGFSAAPMRAVQPRVEARARELATVAAERGEADICADFALPLTTSIIAELVGLPPDDAEMVIGWSHDIVMHRPAPVVEMASFQRLLEYLGQLVSERRRAAVEPDDMITQLMHRPGRPADPEEDDRALAVHVYQLMAAGYPTTAYTIEMTLHALLAAPALWRQLVDAPGLVPAAREEGLRYGSAIRQVFRTAVRDVQVSGRTLPAGSRIVLSLESANRDEDMFEDPNTFRLDRGEVGRQHVAFGTGIHLCLGASLARTEIDAALATLIDICPSLRLRTGARPLLQPIAILNGLETLPVVTG